MKRAAKFWLTAAIILILLGAGIFAYAITLIDGDFSRFSTAQFEMKQYEETADFDSIIIDAETEDIRLERSADDVCRISCQESERIHYDISVKDRTLQIRVVDQRKWYEYIGIFSVDRELIVALPKDAYKALSISANTGDILLPEDFRFEEISVRSDTSKVSCNASAEKTLQIKTSTGDLLLSDCTAGNLKLSTSTGDIDVRGGVISEDVEIHTSTGHIRLNELRCRKLNAESSTGKQVYTDTLVQDSLTLKSNTGDIELTACDAASIRIKTSTGDVSGTLLSEKIFFTKSSTGDIKVPHSTSGGECEITTSTGDIDISIR